jgi:hypothetical protein
MERDGLIADLREIAAEYNDADPEIGHAAADLALLKYINDDEIRQAYEAIERWYA